MDKQIIEVGDKFINLALCKYVTVLSDGEKEPACIQLHFGQTNLKLDGLEAEAALDHLCSCCHDLTPSVEKKQKAAERAKALAEKKAAVDTKPAPPAKVEPEPEDVPVKPKKH